MSVSMKKIEELRSNGVHVIGDLDFRGSDCPLESSEQKMFFSELKAINPDCFNVAAHIRNEGVRSVRQAAIEKSEGLNKGASDIFIPGSPSIVIELKRRDRTICALSREQYKYLVRSVKSGSIACVAFGCSAALSCIALSDHWSQKPSRNTTGED